MSASTGYATGMEEDSQKTVQAYYQRHFQWSFPLEDIFTGCRTGDFAVVANIEQKRRRSSDPDTGLSSLPSSDPCQSSTMCTSSLLHHPDGTYKESV